MERYKEKHTAPENYITWQWNIIMILKEIHLHPWLVFPLLLVSFPGEYFMGVGGPCYRIRLRSWRPLDCKAMSVVAICGDHIRLRIVLRWCFTLYHGRYVLLFPSILSKSKYGVLYPSCSWTCKFLNAMNHGGRVQIGYLFSKIIDVQILFSMWDSHFWQRVYGCYIMSTNSKDHRFVTSRWVILKCGHRFWPYKSTSTYGIWERYISLNPRVIKGYFYINTFSLSLETHLNPTY